MLLFIIVLVGDYEKTAQTLMTLASEEKDLLTRKKSMLSFAKLSSFVANGVGIETEFIENINRELELIQCQEELPDEVLATFGYVTVMLLFRYKYYPYRK